jgi:hypothetical protein
MSELTDPRRSLAAPKVREGVAIHLVGPGGAGKTFPDYDMHIALPNGIVRDWKSTDAPALARHTNDRRIWRNLHDPFPHPYAILRDGVRPVGSTLG